MASIKVKRKERAYTNLSNTPIQSKTLSLKAKGLLLYMFSLPEDWDYTVSGLATNLKEGRDAIGNILKELEEHKYLKRETFRGEGGKFIGNDYELYEEPYASTGG